MLLSFSTDCALDNLVGLGSLLSLISADVWGGDGRGPLLSRGPEVGFPETI